MSVSFEAEFPALEPASCQQPRRYGDYCKRYQLLPIHAQNIPIKPLAATNHSFDFGKTMAQTVIVDHAVKSTQLAFTKTRNSNIELETNPKIESMKKARNSAPFSNFGIRICFEFLDLRSAFDEEGRISIFEFRGHAPSLQ
jgi:hypothetical protein